MDETNKMIEIFETLRYIFYDNANNDSDYYIKPFSLIYNYDKEQDGNIIDIIIDYFITHKCNNYDVNSNVIESFKDYLYSLGCNVKDYICNNDKYTIMHVISQIVATDQIDLYQYTDEFRKLYGNSNLIVNNICGLNIVERFIFESKRPWKSESDYYYEFYEFLGQFDETYNKLDVPTKMTVAEFKSLVYDLYKYSVLRKENYVIDSYMVIWRQLYGHKWNNKLITQEINRISSNEVIKDYFIKYYYRPWKDEHNYINEWNDYIRTLSID